MKKFISTVKNIFSIEDLRIRILNTIGLLIVFRLGSFIVLPGVDPSKLDDAPEGIFGLIDTFLGGAFSNASIFGLGIMPYISASIVYKMYSRTSTSGSRRKIPSIDSVSTTDNR
jgi:preprotein translocase subunit SecY